MEFGVCITILPFSLGSENEEAEREYQNDNQASWVQRMLMALVSDSALFNTREGRAGKVHNFMLGLNLNTSYPMSPLRNFTTQESLDEDELDTAVAGKHPGWNPWKLVQELFLPSLGRNILILANNKSFVIKLKSMHLTCEGL